MIYERKIMKDTVSAKENCPKSEDIIQCGIRKSDVEKIDFTLKVQHGDGVFFKRKFFNKKTMQRS